MSTYAASLDNHKADVYASNAAFVYFAKYTAPVLGLLAAKPGERIADFGCGTGQLTQQISELVGQNGHVVGYDSSQDMLDRARAQTASSIRYLQGDLQSLGSAIDPELEGTFDAIFSSATYHWCKRDPGGVIESAKRLLRPGGRFAFEFGGFGNCVGVRSAIHQVLRQRKLDPIPLDPWYFPTAEQYKRLLEAHGMEVSSIELVPRPNPMQTDLKGWLKTFALNTFFADFDDSEADKALDEVVEICRPDCFWSDARPGQGVAEDETSGKEQGWQIMYVRLRGVAILP